MDAACGQLVIKNKRETEQKKGRSAVCTPDSNCECKNDICECVSLKPPASHRKLETASLEHDIEDMFKVPVSTTIPNDPALQARIAVLQSTEELGSTKDQPPSLTESGRSTQPQRDIDEVKPANVLQPVLIILLLLSILTIVLFVRHL